MGEIAAGIGDADMAALLTALAPRDPLEAMLATQMAAVHDAALRAARRATESAEQPQTEALYARLAARLMHLFVRQLEALERRRVAAEERAKLQARVAEHKERERQRAEERALLLGPARPRRRPARGNTDGGRNRRDGAAGGLGRPDPLSPG